MEALTICCQIERALFISKSDDSESPGGSIKSNYKKKSVMCVRPADEHFSFVCESLLYSQERKNATQRLIQLAMARRVRETNRREPICKVRESRKEISVEEI